MFLVAHQVANLEEWVRVPLPAHCGGSSRVELLASNQKVEGSIPFPRSFTAGRRKRQGSLAGLISQSLRVRLSDPLKRLEGASVPGSVRTMVKTG